MSEDELTDRVENDPSLNAAEKETTIKMCGDEKQLRIFSAKRTVIKSLLKHDYFEPEWVAGEDGESYRIVDGDDADNLDAIYSICGTAPVGLLTVKSKPRSNNHQSSIVNAETIDPEAFA